MTNYNYNIIENLMKTATVEAKKSLATGDVPVGALIVDENMNIVATGHNTREALSLIHGHAEINAINEAMKTYKKGENLMMLVTLEPCPMCTQAICDFGIKTVFYGAPNYTCGGLGTVYNIGKNSNIDSYGGILFDECSNLVKNFFRK